MAEHILEALNDAQRRAVRAIRGPVCILAGAGSGKTTTITHRVAYQIASGFLEPRDILAITFTERAAGEMRTRLTELGAGGVRARTFHAEALAQVAFFDGSPELLPSKAEVVGPLVRRLPAPYRFRPTKDVAGEIERAKNRRVPPESYIDDLGDHTPPMPPELMARVYAEYETRKRRAGRHDFEDLLEGAIRLLERPEAAGRIRGRYRAFTVDEYQDVNLLQQTLLEAWLGDRDEVCVVGDDYQSIYGFTGATAEHLLAFPRRYRGAEVVALEENHRSTPEVLDVANRLVPRLGGRRKVLRSTLSRGPEPGLVEHETGEEETEALITAIRDLAQAGTPLEEIAILYRINARSEDYEEALSRASLPYQVRDGVFLRRPGPRALIGRLGRSGQRAHAPEATRKAARGLGWAPEGEAQGTEEATRQADLTRLVRLAEEHGGTVADFLTDLRGRFEDPGGGRGVVLSTYHRAKGLEWDAVFCPRLEERELPFSLAKTDEAVAEERRLLYVGLTRARRVLRVSWARSRDGRNVRPSRFAAELRPRFAAVRKLGRRRSEEEAAAFDPELFERLKAWRRRTAEDAGVPAYVVFHDATLRAICAEQPASLAALSRVPGVGPTKLNRYGSDVLALVDGCPGS